MSDPGDLRQQLQAAGRYLLANQLTWGNAGNLSARLSAGRYLITASGTHLGNLAGDDLLECSLDGLPPATTAGRRPSKETPMHAAVYQRRPDIQAVLHASPFYSTLIACSDLELPANLFVENIYYLERVARVGYAHPGSAALGELVGQQAAEANVLLLENHGVLVYDVSLSEALMALHTLELVCRMVVEARQAGIAFKPLSAATVHDFLAHAGYRPRREWPT
jgi:ribulose-5-phosphate 4-epimerase/fuculose-1-phosphate aldolase